MSAGRLTLERQWLLRNKIATVLTPLIILDPYFFLFLLLVVQLVALATKVLHGFALPHKLGPSLGELSARLDVWRWHLPVYREGVLVRAIAHDVASA